MKKRSRRWLYLPAALGMLTLSAQFSLSSPNQPEVDLSVPQTLENQGIYGDAIKVFYSSPMLHDQATETLMAAEHPQRQDFPDRNPAKNYHIKITPGSNSATPAFEGTWADLGGEALYHPGDSNKRMVLLKPPSKGHRFFEPGDQVEVTVAEIIVDPQGNRMNVNRNKKHECAS